MELNPMQQKIATAALKTSAPAKHCVDSAIRHLTRSWQLVDTMPEVAGFLAITAEEEAATAVFHALKKRMYNGADQINFKQHQAKNALYPFLLAIQKRFKPLFNDVKVRFFFDPNFPEGQQPFRTGIVLSQDTESEQVAMPQPPLHIISTAAQGNPIDFKKELNELATEKGSATIFKYIDLIANQRNLLLYASSEKIPKLENPQHFILEKHNAVFIILALYLLIEPHKTIQQLPQDALTTFLEIIRRDKARLAAITQP